MFCDGRVEEKQFKLGHCIVVMQLVCSLVSRQTLLLSHSLKVNKNVSEAEGISCCLVPILRVDVCLKNQRSALCDLTNSHISRWRLGPRPAALFPGKTRAEGDKNADFIRSFRFRAALL